MTDSSGMKPLTALLIGSALVLGAVGSGEIGEARAQLEDDGLAIYGTVRFLGNREPVPGAGVSLYDLNTDSETIVTTDSSGRFSFRRLTEGHHVLTLRYPGSQEGTKHWLVFTRRVDLSASVPAPDVALWLAPVSSISGRVLGPDGNPLPGACVHLVRPVSLDGQRFLIGPDVLPFSQSCETDREGVYRWTVSAGDYYLRVTPKPGTDLTTEQYYPGVSRLGEAARVRLGPGGDLRGMDIRLVRDESYRVHFRLSVPEETPSAGASSGTAIDDGEVLEGWIRPVRPGALETRVRRIELEPLGDGSWQTPPLVPGEYELSLRYSDRSLSLMRIATYWVRPDPIAMIRFVLADEDLDLGSIPEISSVSVPGKVFVRSVGAVTLDVADFPALSFSDVRGVGHRRVQPASDGTFVVVRLYPGLFRFDAEVVPRTLPAGWYIASVRSGSQDVLNDGLEVGGSVVDPIEMVIADDSGRIQGVVRGADQALIPEARLVLIPVRRGLFTDFPATVASPSGTFVLEDVPPGEYRMLALDSPEHTGTITTEVMPYWQTAEFLREYELRGERITVDPRARMTINAEVIPIYD